MPPFCEIHQKYMVRKDNRQPFGGMHCQDCTIESAIYRSAKPNLDRAFAKAYFGEDSPEYRALLEAS